MTTKFITVAAATLTMLSACQSTTTSGGTTTTTTTTTTGGGSTTATYIAATVRSLQNASVNGTSVLAYDASGAGSVTQDSKTYNITAMTGAPATIQAFKLGSAEEYAMRIPAPSGTGELITTRDMSQITRTADVVVPTTGTTSYSGSYTGLWGNKDDSETTFVVFGDVALQWALDSDKLTGTIGNRVSQSGSTSLNDVVLSATLDGDGIFGGTTTGGDTSTTDPMAGTFQALPMGPDGKEILGQVNIPSFVLSAGGSLTEYREIGAFLAESN